MIHILIGAVAMAGFLYLADFSRKKNLNPTWWQWSLTTLAFLYAVFVLEVIAGFLDEGALLGALVMGTILGFVAVIWGVLLGRFVFSAGSHQMESTGNSMEETDNV